MLTIDGRKLLLYTTEELWSKLRGEFQVKFDDGIVLTNYKECIYSSYMWDFHRKYVNTPLLLKHHVRFIIGDDLVSSDTHLKLIENVLWSCFDAYTNVETDRVELVNQLAKLAYEVTNHLYNELTYRLEEYVTSIDILDFLEVTNDPRVKNVIEAMLPTQESITHVYASIKNIIKDKDNFKNNSLAKAVKSSIVDMNQTLQCIGPRGLLTDIDSHQFEKPITRGYVKGIRSLHDNMIQSRSAAKSIAFSTDTLQKSEYFSRRQQLICQNVKNLHMGDCGSTNYLMWTVRDNRYDGVGLNRDGDLKTIAGKYYLDETSNTLKMIKNSDTHLIGKTIKLRSVVAGCMHPDPYGVCEVCFGGIAESIPAYTNLGHAACVSMTEIISQMVLSIKHLDSSAVIEGISLKPYEKKYLNAPVNGNLYYLNDSLKNKDMHFVFESNSALGLIDINLVDNVRKLNTTRVSELSHIALVFNSATEIDTIPIKVSINKRLASITHELLDYIKNIGWSITKDNKYSIDMSKWDFKLPILSLPMQHFHMGLHQSEISDMLEATVKDLTIRDCTIEPSAMLINFHDLVNSRLSINLAILDIVVYSSMVVSATQGDYSLPKPWTTSGLGVMRLLLNNRSVAPVMAYERHKNCIISPSNYINTNRFDHPFDSILCADKIFPNH